MVTSSDELENGRTLTTLRCVGVKLCITGSPVRYHGNYTCSIRCGDLWRF